LEAFQNIYVFLYSTYILFIIVKKVYMISNFMDRIELDINYYS